MKQFLYGLVCGAVLVVVVYRYRAWILAKVGINFPPKPPTPPV